MFDSDDKYRHPRLLIDGLLSSVKKYPAKNAVIVGENSYTYSQLFDASTRLANALIQRDILKGDRIAIFMDNTWSSVVSIYATLMTGAVFVVINPQTKADKLAFILEDSESRFLLTDASLERIYSPAIERNIHLVGVIASNIKESKTISEAILNEDFDDVVNNTKPINRPVSVIPNDLAALIYTSGSTGFPKGVMHTHQSMFFASWSLIEYLRMDKDESIMLVLPIAFDYGLYQVLMCMNLGATIIIERSFAFPAKIYQRIDETAPTVFPGVPTIYAMMISAYKREAFSFPSVTKITNTAAALSADYVPWLQKIFPNALIFKMYGLTECKRVCYLEPDLIDKYPSSVGKAIPGTEVFLLTEKGEPVDINEPGILHIRGPHIMAGYWNQPEKSKKMLKPGKIPGENVLCSHDLFRMDEKGLLYFISRSDDIIKTRGEKVSPIEVENVLLKMDEIKEAAVIGVTDETFGQIIVAFIVPEGVESLNIKKVKMHCTKNLEPFMVPKDIILKNVLPKSANGKIDKNILQNEINT